MNPQLQATQRHGKEEQAFIPVALARIPGESEGAMGVCLRPDTLVYDFTTLFPNLSGLSIN